MLHLIRPISFMPFYTNIFVQINPEMSKPSHEKEKNLFHPSSHLCPEYFDVIQFRRKIETIKSSEQNEILSVFIVYAPCHITVYWNNSLCEIMLSLYCQPFIGLICLIMTPWTVMAKKIYLFEV